jgi:hypothetical protein
MPLAKWANVARQFNNSNTESPTGYRRSPTGTEAVGLLAGRLHSTAGFRAFLNSGNEIGVAIKNAFVGDNAALGSIFEDEAVIIPNPQIPYRMKDENFFVKNDSNNGSKSGLREVLYYGGAFTSLRLRTSGIEVSASGGKGYDIEIDYTVIDPDNHIIHLVELKKGLGAQKKGDAVQLIRASQVLAYHYAKVHPGKKLRFKFYFVAGDATDPANIVFYANGQNVNLFEVLTSVGFAELVGMDAARVMRIMRLRPREQKKYAAILLEFEKIMFSDAAAGKTNIHYIPDLIKRLPSNAAARLPEWLAFTTSVSDRVARLKALDDVAPLLFKKRELSKKLKTPGMTNAMEANVFGEWLACVKALSENIAVRDEKREKYKRIIAFTKGVSLARPPTFTLAEKLELRADALGAKRYKMHTVNAAQKRTGNWYTNGQRIAGMQQNLQRLMQTGGGSITRNKLPPFTAWAKRLAGLPISAQAQKSASYQKLLKMANNFGEVIGTRKSGATNNYEAQILSANNGPAIRAVLGKIKANSKLAANRKKALMSLGIQRNAQLTQATLNLARQQAGLPARQSPSRRANNGGAGPAPRRNNGASGSAAQRQASPPKPKPNAGQTARMNALVRLGGMNARELNSALKSLGLTPAQLKKMNRRQKANEFVSKSLASR